jgi:hypothetical protein
MARLTTFSRFIITLGIIAALVFAVLKFFPQLKNWKDGRIQDTTTTTTNGDVATTTTTNNNAPTPSKDMVTTGGQRVPFAYTPPLPVNGKLKGVVELGATGFNSFIIRVDGQKNWKLEKAEYGASLVYEKLATDEDIKSGLKRYIADMLAFGVGPRDIHFVVSSGAKKVDVTDKIQKELNKMNYFVNTVTAEQEGRYALKACLPQAYRGNGFTVDIGSGNTKISYVRGSSVMSYEGPGAKYFQNGTSAAAVESEIIQKCQNIPDSNRGICFIIGGVPFELAKQVRNGKERFTVLKAPGDYKAEGEKQIAGLNIYNAVSKATGCKQFVFDWDANFTIGFLLDM